MRSGYSQLFEGMAYTLKLELLTIDGWEVELAIVNKRRQHPVGQGFFHSADIYVSGRPSVSYVYDCGSMERYAGQRKLQISQYLCSCSAPSKLDILFISHVHSDHISGVEQLLSHEDGLQVDTIVLPLLNQTDRLIAFARSASEDWSSARRSFYKSFVTDPVDALSRFRPRQIIFVEAGNRDIGAPDGGDRPLEPPDGGPLSGPDDLEDGPTWKLVGRGTVSRIDGGPGRPDSSATQQITQSLISDNLAMLTPSPHGDWLLAPFVDPTVVSHRMLFRNELANQCGIPRRRIEAWLQVASNVKGLLSGNASCIKAAYKAVSKDLNITSMCLYSGPTLRPSNPSRRSYIGTFGSIYAHGNASTRLGWLGTGDAALKHSRRQSDFLRHYGELLREVTTLTLPHHGSDHNFGAKLLVGTDPRVCVAAADRFSNWNHPGSRAVQAVCSHPAVMHVVTSSPSTRAEEVAALV